MSDLLHLVEAASALTRLPVGPANLPATTQRSPASSSSASPVPSFAAPAKEALAPNYMMAAHSISDDDDFLSDSTIDSSTSKMATLRENHLRALRSAAVNAGAGSPTTLDAPRAIETTHQGSNGYAAASAGLAKRPSFTRGLDRWGFRQISRDPDAGAFCHELFRRDEADPCRGMVFQKSRKPESSLASATGTRPIASSEKRLYSSTVTVSTAGGTSDESMPLKKRKTGRYVAGGIRSDGIPCVITHRNKKVVSSSSVPESDLTRSDQGPVCSNKKAYPTATDAMEKSPHVAVEVKARETLTRHFREQHRAYALASLAENGRLALEAANSKSGTHKTEAAAEAEDSSSDSAAQISREDNRPVSPPMLGAVTTISQVFAPTVTIQKEKLMNAAPIAKAARSALYEAYVQALSRNPATRS